MASLNIFISLINFLVYFSLLLFSYFPEKTKAIGSHFHEVEITSLLTAPVCNRQTSTGSNSRKYSTRLEVVHGLGPCSTDHEQTKNKPSLVDILLHDQSRVDYIHARLKRNIRNNKVSLPAHLGLPLVTLNYVVNIGLGTPQQNVTLIIDTGSGFTWTQCKPCINCYRQRDPVYNPQSSSTYSKISCGSPLCSKLGLSCNTGPCVYNNIYNDSSYSKGVVNKDRLTITSSTKQDVFQDFLFGCGHNNNGTFGEATGVLGLGRRAYEMSFLYQTEQKYGLYFSYCLPSTISSPGHLTFGRKNKSNRSVRNMKFTRFIAHPVFYRIEIVAISVGGTPLPINHSVFQNPGMIIDSGALITRLPKEAYVKMRNTFKQMMGLGSLYPTAPAYLILDTCFYINNGVKNINVPHVSFIFGGGVEVELDKSGIILVVNKTMACLAFAENTKPYSYGVFGSIQQRTLEVVYDVGGETIGFGNGGCK